MKSSFSHLSYISYWKSLYQLLLQRKWHHSQHLTRSKDLFFYYSRFVLIVSSSWYNTSRNVLLQLSCILNINLMISSELFFYLLTDGYTHMTDFFSFYSPHRLTTSKEIYCIVNYQNKWNYVIYITYKQYFITKLFFL